MGGRLKVSELAVPRRGSAAKKKEEGQLVTESGQSAQAEQEDWPGALSKEV